MLEVHDTGVIDEMIKMISLSNAPSSQRAAFLAEPPTDLVQKSNFVH